MQGQKISRLALAVAIAFSGTLFSSLTVAETPSWNSNISIGEDQEIIYFTNGSILDKSNDTAFTVNGNNRSVTLIGDDADDNSGHKAFRATSDVTFKNFSELTIKGNGDTKQTFWVSSSQEKGPSVVQFGEENNAIGSLTIENFNIGSYYKTTDNSGEAGDHINDKNKDRGKISFYANTLKFEDSDISINNFTFTVNKVDGAQSTMIDGNLDVGLPADDDNAENYSTAKFEVLGGNLTVNGSISGTNSGDIILGTNESKLGTVTLNDTVNIYSAGKVSIAADKSTVEKDITVLGKDSTYEILSGAFTSRGTIKAKDSGNVLLGSQEQALTKIELGKIINDSASFSANSSGDVTVKGVNNNAFAIDVSNGSTTDFVSSGILDIQKGINAGGSETNLNLSAGEIKLNDEIRVGSTAQIGVKANSASLEGQVILNGGQISFSSADDEMMESLSITHKDVSYDNNTLHATDGGKIDIKAKKLSVIGNMFATDKDSSIEVTAINTQVDVSSRLSVKDSGVIHFRNTRDNNQKLTIVSSSTEAILTAGDGNFIVDNGSVDITGTVQANGKGNINFGSKDHLLSDITITDNAANAVRSNSGSVNLYAESVDITGNNGAAVEVFNLGRDGEQEDKGVMNIYASDNLNISGNIVVGKDAGQQNVSDYTNDNAALNIGTLNDDTVVMIDGDVTVYNRSNDEGELKTNNIANISLGNKNSEFTGSINDYVIEDSGSVVASAQNNVGTNLNLGEATWNVTNDSTVGAVKAENGYIDAQQSKVKIKKLTGAGALFAINQIVSDEEEAQVQIESGEAGTEVSSYFAGNIGDELAAGQISEQDIVNSSAQIKNRATDANHGNLYLDGGWISGNKQYTWDDAKNTYFLTSQEENLFSTGNIDLAKINAVAWRNELTSLTDRMSTLRTAPEFAGVWARYKGGEWDGDSINQQFNGVEVGVDKAINQNFVVGLAASYIEGNGDLDNGSADTDSYSCAAYLSYYNSCSFVDVMGKLGKIETDFDLNYNGLKDSGDYTMSGYLFGVETGYRFNFNNFYVEPQVQLTYSYLGSKEFTTDNRTIDFETLESLIGRVGFMSGYDFGDIGSAYLRASYYHDFDGDVDMRVGHNDLFVTESDELNSDWGDVGIGANVNFGEATLFFDVSRSFGGDIDLEWKANAGARYMF